MATAARLNTAETPAPKTYVEMLAEGRAASPNGIQLAPFLTRTADECAAAYADMFTAPAQRRAHFAELKRLRDAEFSPVAREVR